MKLLDLEGLRAFKAKQDAAVAAAYAEKADVPTKVSQLSNDSGYQTTSQASAAYAPKTHDHPAATASAAGFMSSTDKSKLDGMASGATKVVVDAALSSTSANAIQNKAVDAALSGKAASTHGHAAATASAAGFMSAADKGKLDGISAITTAEIDALF